MMGAASALGTARVSMSKALVSIEAARATGGLLASATRLEPAVLGAESAVLLAGRGPGGLDEGGLEPGVAFPEPRRASLARAFIITGAQARPRNEMGRGGERRHVGSDLSQDDRGDGVADARNGQETLKFAAKGAPDIPEAILDEVNGLLELLDLMKMNSQQQPVTLRGPASKRLAHLIDGRLDLAAAQGQQDVGIGLAFDERPDDRPSGDAEDMRQNRFELDVGLLERVERAPEKQIQGNALPAEVKHDV